MARAVRMRLMPDSRLASSHLRTSRFAKIWCGEDLVRDRLDARRSREAGLFEIAEIGRDRLDLRFGQIMRDRPHDGRVVRLGLVLASFLVPVCQLLEDVVIE